MTATVPSPPATRPARGRSPHERRILHAIGEGANIDALLKCPRWTVDDVTQTMQRYDLTVTEDGRLVKKPGVRHDLAHMAEFSPSPHVRQRAAAAIEQLRRLSEALDEHNQQTAWETEKARRREALELWREWLRDALHDVSTEIRRLRPRPTKGAVKCS